MEFLVKKKHDRRQGEPLSPLLDVITSELLQAIINDVWHIREIELHVPQDYGQKYPVIQYEDDTLMIMPADPTQLDKLRNIL